MCRQLKKVILFIALFILPVMHLSATSAYGTEPAPLSHSFTPPPSLSDTVGTNIPDLRSSGGTAMKGLLYTLGFLFLVTTWMKHRKSNGSRSVEQLIEVLQRKDIGRASLIVIQACGKKLLLSQTASEVRFLTTLEPSPEFEVGLDKQTTESSVDEAIESIMLRSISR